MIDSFYTDREFASALADSMGETYPRRIADFACGHGALLEAATLRWPDSEIVAVDIAAGVEEELANRVPHAKFLNADLFSVEMPSPEDLGFFDLILLNPPFSCRGSKTVQIHVDGMPLRCSRAFAFVVRSLSYLDSRGALAAILPSSCLFSDKDRAAREFLETRYEIAVVPTSSPARFRGCSVNTALVHIGRAEMPHLVAAGASSTERCEFQLVRGARPNGHAFTGAGSPSFVHTTELQSGVIKLHRFPGPYSRDREIIGPAILLPRVGRPVRGKLCFLKGDIRIRISDCIVAVTHPDEDVLRATFEFMHSDWDRVRRLYQGTCATYVTVERLNAYLSSLGVHTEALSVAA